MSNAASAASSSSPKRASFANTNEGSKGRLKRSTKVPETGGSQRGKKSTFKRSSSLRGSGSGKVKESQGDETHSPHGPLRRSNTSKVFDQELRHSMARLTAGGSLRNKQELTSLMGGVEEAARGLFLSGLQQVESGSDPDEGDLVLNEEHEVMLREISIAALQAVERKRRIGIVFRAFLRPKLLFCSRMLPVTRFTQVQSELLEKKQVYLITSEPVYRDLVMLDESYGRRTIELTCEEQRCRELSWKALGAAIAREHADLYASLCLSFGHAQLLPGGDAGREIAQLALMEQEERERLQVDTDALLLSALMHFAVAVPVLRWVEVSRISYSNKARALAHAEEATLRCEWQHREVHQRSELMLAFHEEQTRFFSRLARELEQAEQQARAEVAREEASVRQQLERSITVHLRRETNVLSKLRQREERAHADGGAAAGVDEKETLRRRFQQISQCQLAVDVDGIIERTGVVVEDQLLQLLGVAVAARTGDEGGPGDCSGALSVSSVYASMYKAYCELVYHIKPSAIIANALDDMGAAHSAMALHLRGAYLPEKQWLALMHVVLVAKQLTHLNLSTTQLDDERLAVLCFVLRLAKLTMLRTIDLSSNARISPTGIRLVQQTLWALPSLQSIDVTGIAMLPIQRKVMSAVLRSAPVESGVTAAVAAAAVSAADEGGGNLEADMA